MARARKSDDVTGTGPSSVDDATAHMQAERARALEIILDAWDLALEDGIDPANIASAVVFAAFTDLVENHGEEFVAQMVEGLPGRIRAGDFTLSEVAVLPDDDG
jgi:hypothetical protein